MIRVGLPVPTLLGLRRQPVRRVAREERDPRQNEDSGVVRPLPLLNGLIARIRLKETDTPCSVSEAIFSQFEDRYQRLVDLLCWSAHGGVTSEEKQKYADLRQWFLQNYEPVRPVLSRHLKPEMGDTTPPAETATAPRDAFESLFLPSDLDCLIHSETVISRIQRTRNALEACREEISGIPA